MKTKTKAAKKPTEMLPPMPKEAIVQPLTEPLSVKLSLDTDRFSSGGLSMTIGDTESKIVSTNGKTRKQKELGYVIGCLGGGILIAVGKRQWHLSPLELWKSVQRADADYRKRASRGHFCKTT